MQNQPTLDPTLLSTYKGKYSFFYGSWLSNWASARFQAPSLSRALSHLHPEGIPETWNFNTSEQYMMLQKALCFSDWEIAGKILVAEEPDEQKFLGRHVRNFDAETWNSVSRAAVYEGCLYKFTQNKRALEHLLATKNTLLVEASPSDCIWGVGLGETDPKVYNPDNWRGSNWLGEVLTKLRDNLLKEDLTSNPYLD